MVVPDGGKCSNKGAKGVQDGGQGRLGEKETFEADARAVALCGGGRGLPAEGRAGAQALGVFPARSVLEAARRPVWLELSEGAESHRDEVREEPSLWASQARPRMGAFPVRRSLWKVNGARPGSDVSETASCLVDLG